MPQYLHVADELVGLVGIELVANGSSACAQVAAPARDLLEEQSQSLQTTVLPGTLAQEAFEHHEVVIVAEEIPQIVRLGSEHLHGSRPQRLDHAHGVVEILHALAPVMEALEGWR